MLARDPIVVIGGGLTGLATAWRLVELNCRVELVESRAYLGGLAATRHLDGMDLHPGIHLLHPSNDQMRPLLDKLASLFGEHALWVKPKSMIYFMDSFLDFPFKSSQLIQKLGPKRTALVIGSAANAWIARALQKIEPVDSFENVVSSSFGSEFYNLFFRDYTEKVLGVPPELIAGEWARRRVPTPSGRNLLQTLLPWWRPKSIEHAHSPFSDRQLCSERGMAVLVDALVNSCGDNLKVRRSTTVKRIDVENNRIRSITMRTANGRDQTVHVQSVVSTIPITDLIAAIEPAVPETIVADARSLSYRALIYVYLAISRPRLFDAQWIYFQSKDIPFNRLSEVSNAIGIHNKNGKNVLCAEITVDVGSAQWKMTNERLFADCIIALRNIRPDIRDGELTPLYVDREPAAYPAMMVGYEQPLDRILHYLDNIEGLETAGRQGRFEYLNMDETMLAGIEAAEKVVRSIDHD
jgi:protoporphyrinogen oxidase